MSTPTEVDTTTVAKVAASRAGIMTRTATTIVRNCMRNSAIWPAS